jgi:hypothetical protein
LKANYRKLIGLEYLCGTNAEASFTKVGHEAAVTVVQLHVGGGGHGEAVLRASFWGRLGIRASNGLFFVLRLGLFYFGLVQGARERGRERIQIFWRIMAVDCGCFLGREFLMDDFAAREFLRKF